MTAAEANVARVRPEPAAPVANVTAPAPLAAPESSAVVMDAREAADRAAVGSHATRQVSASRRLRHAVSPPSAQ